MHHFLDRESRSPVENPGAVIGLDLNELYFNIGLAGFEGHHSNLPSLEICSSPWEIRVTLVATDTLLVVLSL